MSQSSSLPERREPTHVLRVQVPLCLSDPAPDFDTVADAVTVALAISRAAYGGYICDGAQVAMIDPLLLSRESDSDK